MNKYSTIEEWKIAVEAYWKPIALTAKQDLEFKIYEGMGASAFAHNMFSKVVIGRFVNGHGGEVYDMETAIWI